MAVTETDKLNKANNVIDVTNARAIIFDRQWEFGANNVHGAVGLRVIENPQNQQCQFSWSVGIADYLPLQYDVDVNGDTYREFGLPAECKLYVDIANFRTSRRQVAFDLLVELKLPIGFVAPVRLFNDTVHCAVPTTTMVEEQLRAATPNIAQLERTLASMRAITAGSN